MDRTLFISTFIAILLAELGDKTQIATVAISGYSQKPLVVFIGSSTALILASFIGAIAGGSFARVIPTDIIKLVAAIGFIFIGSKLLLPLVVKALKRSNDNT